MAIVVVWLEALTRALLKIGARLKVVKRRSGSPLVFNVGTDRQGEFFSVTMADDMPEDLEVQVLETDPDLAQALIMIKSKSQGIKNKVLLGHDERHWFVSALPVEARNIKDAFRLLKPEAVRLSQERAKVGTKTLDKRRNKGFIRQGEWFFVPVAFSPSEDTIIRKKEPLQRAGGSTPHTVEELVRFGGETVYLVGSSVLTRRQLDEYRRGGGSGFVQERRRGARVLVRGKVTHKDHATVTLRGWHEVYINGEQGSSFNGFLD